MQKIIKFIMENKLFILQLTFLGIIAMNQTAFASDFAMNTSSPFDEPINKLKTIIVDNLPKVFILIATVLAGFTIAMGESQITGKISKLFLGAIAACFAGSIFLLRWLFWSVFLMKYTIPVFKALTERATLLGGPKEIVLLNAVLALIIWTMFNTLWIIPFNLIIHFFSIYVNKFDDRFFICLLKFLHKKKFYDV